LGIDLKKEMSQKQEQEQAVLNRTTFWKDGCMEGRLHHSSNAVERRVAYVPPSKAAARKWLQLLHEMFPS
jgi:hypothetical protein